MVMYTPAPSAKRKLIWSTPRRAPYKRARTATTAFRFQNRRVPAGVSRTGTLTQQVRSLQSYVNKLKPEKKYHEVDLALTNIADAAGGIVPLLSIAAGDSAITRTGDAIQVLDIKLGFDYTRSGAGNNGFVRFAIVQDKQQVADTSPTVTNIFSGASPIGLPTVAALERYSVLYLSPVKSGAMMGINSSTTVPSQNPYSEYSWKGNIKALYNGSGTGDIQKNGLYFVILCTGFADLLDLTGTARVGFTDA